MGNREQGWCQRWEQKNRSGRKASCGGASGETGEPLTYSCLLWTVEAACCELECFLAGGLRNGAF